MVIFWVGCSRVREEEQFLSDRIITCFDNPSFYVHSNTALFLSSLKNRLGHMAKF